MSKSLDSAGTPGVDRCSDATTGESSIGPRALSWPAALFERVRDAFTIEELQTVEAEASERARSMAFEARDLCEGLACLVAEDRSEGAANTGCFQTPESVHSLLSHLSGHFNAIFQQLELGTAAWAALRQRERRQ